MTFTLAVSLNPQVGLKDAALGALSNPLPWSIALGARLSGFQLMVLASASFSALAWWFGVRAAG